MALKTLDALDLAGKRVFIRVDFNVPLDAQGKVVREGWCPKFVDHVAVVNDLVTHIDRRSVNGERTLDDLDRAVDPGAESARLGQQNFHHSSTPITRTENRTGKPASG